MKLDIWTIIIIIAVLIILVLLLVSKQKEKKNRDNTLANSTAISSGLPGAVINVKQYTDRILSDFQAWTADTALYDELSALNDDIIRAIWSDYDTRIKNLASNPEKGKTLGLALYDSYYPTRCCTFGWDWTYHAKKFHDKLKAIGLP